MGASLNRVTLLGRLGKDPEVRYTTSGTAVANFSLATDETFKDRAGEKQKKTEWHRLVAWQKTAEIVGEYLHKGDLVLITGKLQTREFESDGQKRSITEIVVTDLKMVQTGNGGTNTGGAPQQARTSTARPAQRPAARPAQGQGRAAAPGRPAQQRPAQRPPQQVSPEPDPSDEDIPF